MKKSWFKKRCGVKKEVRRVFGFTLTELLVVVVIVGVLSAVAVPKFTRAVETRRAAEAEEMLTAVRTEQEKRCSLDQKYAVEFSQLNQLVSNPQTDNYTYVLSAGGVSAASRGKSYSLSVPSYQDGRLCCSGSYCEKLNKNYPLCTAMADVKRDASCELSACEIDPNNCGCPSYAASHCECTGTCDPCAGKTCSGPSSRSCPAGTSGTQYRSCDCGTWSDWTGACVPDEPEDPCAGKTCSGPSTQSCPAGYTGMQTRTCSCGTWSDWTGTCTPDAPDAKECSGASSQPCGCNNRGTQTRSCDTTTGSWSGWSACSVGDCECSAGQSETGAACGNCGKQKRTCGSDGSWGAWSCSGEGQCKPGEKKHCNVCGTSTCNSMCSWGGCVGNGTYSAGYDNYCLSDGSCTQCPIGLANWDYGKNDCIKGGESYRWPCNPNEFPSEWPLL